jgi:MoxR-like ATPase
MSGDEKSFGPGEMSSGVPRSVLDARNTLHNLREQVRRELDGVVIGYDEPLDLMIVAAVAGGHVLVEGPPGIAKTLMAGSVARVLGVALRRVKVTPDTSPEEITGYNVTRAGETKFMHGAAFTNVLLADEINRTPPRTQAALLEAMQDRNVTVEGRTHWLPSPFMVIGTQNPYEHEGIFPLPESQLDRFLFKIHLDYGSAAVERAVRRLPHHGLAPDVLRGVSPLVLDRPDLGGRTSTRHRATTSSHSSSTSSAVRAWRRVSSSAPALAPRSTCSRRRRLMRAGGAAGGDEAGRDRAARFHARASVDR